MGRARPAREAAPRTCSAASFYFRFFLLPRPGAWPSGGVRGRTGDRRPVVGFFRTFFTCRSDVPAISAIAASGSELRLRFSCCQCLTELLLHRGTSPKEVPTLAEFETRFVQEFAVANRQKPSTIASKKMILKKYLVPQLGRKRLDEIKHEDVQR